MNREAWLNELASRLRPKFEEKNYALPENLRISVGFPSSGGLSQRKPTIGQCWYSEASGDNTFEIFISPTIADGLRAGDVLVHELCHSVLPYGTKHGRKFATLAKLMGLEGKPTATVAGSELTEELITLMIDMPPYPHAELKPLIVPKTQTTRMRKITCQQCGYQVRTTKKWIEVGLPTCPFGHAMIAEDVAAEGGPE